MMVMETKPGTSLKTRILIVAPNNEEGRRLERCLNAVDGFEAVIINYEEAARTDTHCLRPQLVLLVIPEDERRGLQMLRRLRHVEDLPLVICSNNGAEEEVIRGLESGASDYLVIPLQLSELAARLHAVLRRCGSWPVAQPESKVLMAGELEIHVNERRVFRNGKPVDLTPIEFKLLMALVRRPGQLVSHEQLLTEVWGPQYTDSPHYVRLYMRYLRIKIEDDPHAPMSLVSEWGLGYRFEPNGSPGPSRRTPVNGPPSAVTQQQGAAAWRGGDSAWLSPAGHTAST